MKLGECDVEEPVACSAAGPADSSRAEEAETVGSRPGLGSNNTCVFAHPWTCQRLWHGMGRVPYSGRVAEVGRAMMSELLK